MDPKPDPKALAVTGLVGCLAVIAGLAAMAAAPALRAFAGAL